LPFAMLMIPGKDAFPLALFGVILLFLSASSPSPAACPGDRDFHLKRRAMVEEQIKRRGVSDREVLAAMLSVCRHQFVPARYLSSAYDDSPLPIGHGQTISQPFIVAYMTEILKLSPESKVLEIGTGSGYQVAVAAKIAKTVYSIEIIPELAASSGSLLKRLGLTNVKTTTGDGYFGWSEHAPYDAIIVTAAAGHIPPSLIAQLKPGGRMVIPVGGAFQVQNLVLVEKRKDLTITTRSLMPVRFVPLTGRH